MGQTLALLEAMKMFTELVSPIDGILVAILTEDGQGVKTGTPLFKFATPEVSPATLDGLLPVQRNTPWQNRFGLLSVSHPPAGWVFSPSFPSAAISLSDTLGDRAGSLRGQEWWSGCDGIP